MYPQNTCKRILRIQGIYVTIEFSLILTLKGLWTSITNHKKLVPRPVKEPNKCDQVFVKELLECGELKNPREVCFEQFSRVIRQLDECEQLVLWGCLISCRAAILAATCGGRYRKPPYIWGLVKNLCPFGTAPLFSTGTILRAGQKL